MRGEVCKDQVGRDWRDLVSRGAAVTAVSLNFLENGGGGWQPETAPAIFFRDEGRKKTRSGEISDERVRVGALGVETPPELR
jgi:hypothetical protein